MSNALLSILDVLGTSLYPLSYLYIYQLLLSLFSILDKYTLSLFLLPVPLTVKNRLE